MLALSFILLSAVFPAIHSRCPDTEIRDDRPILDTYYESPSGHFWIHYDLTGDNAPNLIDNNANGFPDYVESTAEAADSARDILTGIMGYIEEENDEDEKYDIYIVQLSSSLWGLCQSESGGGSFIKIRKNYQDMSNLCNNETDLLWLTVGHEFFHAIQDTYRSNSNDSYFRELTSMWFENIFVPECYDFLDFINPLFNNPEKGFDDNTSGSAGYSLALYGHYLSKIIDFDGTEDQTSSKIIREIWEDYSGGGTIFSSLKSVLENDNYNTSFPETWVDFMSRNMFCGKYDNMENDIYYHISQSFIDPPDVEYEAIGNENIIEVEDISINNDRVSIYAYQAIENISVITEFSSTDIISRYGLLSDDVITDINQIQNYNFLSIEQTDKFFFMFTDMNGLENFDFTLNINFEPTINRIVSLYPNPLNTNTNTLTIIYDQVSGGEVDIQIFNLKGRLISEEFVLVLSGRQYISYGNHLDIPSGIYFLKVSSNGNTEIIKFINIK